VKKLGFLEGFLVLSFFVCIKEGGIDSRALSIFNGANGCKGVVKFDNKLLKVEEKNVMKLGIALED
jgi:hypothetical protein